MNEQQHILEEESWDKKKIAIGAAALIIIIAGGIYFKTYFFNNTTQKVSVKPHVLSANSSNPVIIREQLQEKLDTLKSQVNNLDVVDVAQNSPQYKKAMEDFQNIQNLPHEQVKQACVNICNGL